MQRCLAFALFLGGCQFNVHNVDLAGGSGDDLATTDGTDLAGGGDDMATAPPDLVPPSDMTPPVMTISHVPEHWITDPTCDLVVSTSINTSTRKVDGADVPTGCAFMGETESGGLSVAVLSARSVTFNGTVTVGGSVPLVVVARTTITINGLVDGSATMATAGPGGAASAMGAGAGPSGQHAASLYADSGGSGGSYGSVGGLGGVGSYMGSDTPAQTAGAIYGTTLLTASVPGGSGGGNGHSEGCTPAGTGGAGGGSIQLSAGSSITNAVGGSINVGGGGGGLGCINGATDEASGGGGGSGGAIFLESPTVSITGGLWANGGSGGGGASGAGAVTGAGKNGNDATLSQTPAAGGATGGDYGGAGGNGAAGATDATHGGEGGATPIANGGGGGGGAGRIVVRSHGAAPINMANVSPAPALDATIP
ncbi:MAG: hypothetical protein ACXVDD_17320 [Polyangia bacterium]